MKYVTKMMPRSRVPAKSNLLKDRYPELLKEWDYENNTVDPNLITYAARKKIAWKCKRGHRWKARVDQRTRSNTQCPYCAGVRVLPGFNDLETANPTYLKEWNYKKNTVLPSEVTPSGIKKVWWTCKYGHDYQATLYHRANGTGCPICFQEKRTSVPEKIVYYYLKQVLPDAIGNYKPDWLDGKEIDIYIPSIDLSIEYDGSAWHEIGDAENKDRIKDELFKNLGKTILRIREPGLPELNDNSICFQIEKRTANYEYLQTVVVELFQWINQNYHLDLTIDINIDRDISSIRDLIEFMEVKNSLKENYPDVSKEWDYENNGKLRPEHVSCFSHKRVSWSCSTCGHHWTAVIYSRARGKGCPNCYKMRIKKKKV